jgi:hypothetical protein
MIADLPLNPKRQYRHGLSEEMSAVAGSLSELKRENSPKSRGLLKRPLDRSRERPGIRDQCRTSWETKRNPKETTNTATAAYWMRIQIPGRSLQTLLKRQSLQFFISSYLSNYGGRKHKWVQSEQRMVRVKNQISRPSVYWYSLMPDSISTCSHRISFGDSRIV